VEAFARRTRDEWVAELAGADTCVAPVLSIAEVAASPQFVARGVVARAVHPTEGPLLQLAPLLAGMARPAAAQPVALPDMTQSDTEHLLKEAGVDGETVARWVARQVVA
jgi:alpha-methylacyl-CoA racemase